VRESDGMGEQVKNGEVKDEAVGQYRLAWMSVAGWRARLRVAGDVVERERHDHIGWKAKRVMWDTGDTIYMSIPM